MHMEYHYALLLNSLKRNKNLIRLTFDKSDDFKMINSKSLSESYKGVIDMYQTKHQHRTRKYEFRIHFR